jgi:hypothetical protein
MLQGTCFSRAPCSRTSARVLVRGTARVIRQSLRAVFIQAERRNGTNSRPPCGNRLDARMASGISRDMKLHVYSRRSTVPHFCVPPDDAAIAACQVRALGALISTHFRDKSLCELVDLGLNRSHPQAIRVFEKNETLRKKPSMPTETDLKRPHQTVLSPTCKKRVKK